MRTNPWLRKGGVYLAILAFSCGLVGLQVHAHPQISVIDEFQHTDYLYRVSQAKLVREGRIVGPETMREASCRGFDVDFRLPACNAPHRPEQYPGGGVNTAALNPPAYYAITAAVALPLTRSGLVPNLLTAGRLVGGLWLGMGLILTWIIAAELGASVTSRVILTVLLAATPPVLYMSGLVNPETTSLAAGGLILLAALRWEDHRWRMILLPIVGAVGVSMRTASLICVLAVALYLVIRALQQRRSAWTTHGAAALLLVGGAVAAQLAWLVIRHSIALPGATPNGALPRVSSLPAGHLFAQLYALVTPVDWYSPFAVIHGPIVTTPALREAMLAAVRVLGWFLLAACLGSILYARRWGRDQVLSVAGFTILVLGGPLLLLSVYLSEHQDFTVPARYGLSVLPLLGAIAARSLRNRVALYGVGAFAAVSLAMTLFSVVHIRA